MLIISASKNNLVLCLSQKMGVLIGNPFSRYQVDFRYLQKYTSVVIEIYTFLDNILHLRPTQLHPTNVVL